MPDIGLNGTGKTGARDTFGRFVKGQSGNLAGRPRGIPNPTARAAMLFDGQVEALAGKAIELALAGDIAAIRLCLDRTIGPRRGRPVALALPPIASTADLATAMASVVAAAAQGRITPDEALALSQMVETFTRTLDAAHVERRRLWRGRLMLADLKARRKRPAGIRAARNQGPITDG